MPNPVLLAANAFVTGMIAIDGNTVGGANLPTGTVTVSVKQPTSGPKPLWILDGQHRIQGLAASKQGGNSLPVVLLLDPDTGVYNGSLLAEIFAQVTTKAEQLDVLHHQWLTYAFKLGDYELDPTGNDTASRLAFEVAIELCDNHKLGGAPNPFFNAIAFNSFLLQPHTKNPPPTAAQGGFSYSCLDIRDLFKKSYFEQRPAHGVKRLNPHEVAAEIAAAYSALYPLVSKSQDSVFFGLGKKGHKIMQDAFLIGAMQHLLRHGEGADWTVLLKTLKFDSTDWNFDDWTQEGGLSGPWSTASRKVARAVLSDCFARGALPYGVSDLASYMQGDGASVAVICSELTAKGRPATAKTKRIEIQLSAAAKKAQVVNSHPHVRIAGATPNIGKYVVWDNDAPAPKEVQQLKRGMLLPSDHPLPWSIKVEMRYYGGSTGSGDIRFRN